MYHIRLPSFPKYTLWITNTIIQFSAGIMLNCSRFTPEQTAVLLTLGLLWWVRLCKEDDNTFCNAPQTTHYLADPLGLPGPIAVTIGFWLRTYFIG